MEGGHHRPEELPWAREGNRYPMKLGNLFTTRATFGALAVFALAGCGADGPGNAYVGSGADGSPATVTKLDPNGNTLWTRSIGTGAVQSIAVDANRNVIASGPALGTVKLNPGGHVQWSKSFGGHAAFD